MAPHTWLADKTFYDISFISISAGIGIVSNDRVSQRRRIPPLLLAPIIPTQRRSGTPSYILDSANRVQSHNTVPPSPNPRETEPQ